MQKWQTLFTQLKVCNDIQEILTEKELLNFETQTGIVLPAEYKKFCQFFGTGMFGDFIRIYSPTFNWHFFSQGMLKTIKYEINHQFYPKEEYGKIMKIESILNILDSAFIFGDDAGANIAILDLRTYRKLDLSCDIYWMTFPDFDGDIYYIGRDFYKFVTDFCLGMQCYKIMPEIMCPSPELIYNSFTCFKCKNYSYLESAEKVKENQEKD